MPRPAAIAILTALAALATAHRAAAYCRMALCKDAPDPCTPFQISATCDVLPGPSCTPIAWDRPCVGFAVQEDASSSVALADARAKLDAAFAVWESADCGGGVGPGIAVLDMGVVSCADDDEYDDAGNANILIFRDEGFTDPQFAAAIALTTVTVDCDTQIDDADIEVSTPKLMQGQYDLFGVLVHETGHFLGLDHTQVPNATMTAGYQDGLDTLEPDDVTAVCTAYPPREIDTATCNPIPEHGFSPLCRSEQIIECGAAPGPGTGRGAGAGPLLAAGGLAAALVRARTRRRAGRVSDPGPRP